MKMLLTFTLTPLIFICACLGHHAPKSADNIANRQPNLALNSPEVQTLRLGKPVEGHTAEIRSIFRLNSRQFISIDQQGLALVWAKNNHSWQSHELFYGPTSLEYADFQNPYLALSSASKAYIYDLNSDLSRPIFSKDFQTRISSLVFHSSALLVGATDSRVYRWKFMQDSALLERYIAHDSVVSALAVDRQGRVFYSGDWQGNFYAWLSYDANGQNLDELSFRTRTSPSEYYTSDATKMKGAGERAEINFIKPINQQWLVLASKQGQLEAWKIRGLRKQCSLLAHKGLIYALAISQPGLIATAGRDSKLNIWELVLQESDQQKSTCNFIKKHEYEMSNVSSLSFIEDRIVVVGKNDGQVIQLDLGK